MASVPEMVEAYDWSAFEITYFYAAPLDVVYRSWATADGLAAFFIREAHFEHDGGGRSGDELVQAGDRYTWTWYHPATLPGTVLDATPNTHVAYAFGTMRIDVRLEDVGDATKVVLRQSGIPEDKPGQVMGHLNCRSCWVFFMTNLTSVLEHGRDLRDTARPDRVSSMEVGYPIPSQ